MNGVKKEDTIKRIVKKSRPSITIKWPVTAVIVVSVHESVLRLLFMPSTISTLTLTTTSLSLQSPLSLTL